MNEEIIRVLTICLNSLRTYGQHILIEKTVNDLIQKLQQDNSIPVEKPVKPANDGNIFEMNIYTGRVNGSDIHQKEEQYVWFIANNKKQIEQLINDLCRVIRQTDETNTHNETIAGIIGDANRLSV